MSTYKSLLNTTSVQADNVNTDNLTVLNLAVTETCDIAGAILNMDQVDDSTIEYASYNLRVKDGGISTSKIADSAVTNDKIDSVDASKITGTYSPSSINVDTINEKTLNNGVTIDGVLIKDGDIPGFVTETGIQTLSNKTLTTPNIDSITGVVFSSAPGFTGWVKSDLVSADRVYNNNAGTDLLLDTQTTEKVTVYDSKFQIMDNSDSTKRVAFEASGLTTATTRTLTVPNASGTIALTSDIPSLSGYATLTGTETLTNKSVQDDSFYFRDGSDSNRFCRISANDMTTGIDRIFRWPDLTAGTFCMTAGTQTLTDKNLVDASTYIVDNSDTSKKMQFQISGVTTGTTRTLTVPNASTTIVGTDVQQTITNKNFDDANCYFVDTADNTKKVLFNVSSSQTTGTTCTYNLPWSSGMTSEGLVGSSIFQQVTNKTMSYENNYFTPYFGAIYKTSTQSISSSTYTQITSWTKWNDTSVSGSAIVDAPNARLKLSKVGYWMIFLSGNFASNSTGYRAMEVRIATSAGSAGSSASIAFGETNSANPSSQVTWSHIVFYKTSATNDYAYFYAWQNSGGSLNFGSTNANNYALFGALWLGDSF